jgi:hypothetical protein
MCAAATLASAVRTHASDDCDAAVATIIGVVRNERGRCHSLSREDQCVLLVEPAGSESATYVRLINLKRHVFDLAGRP